jgi:hypothetical protein
VAGLHLDQCRLGGHRHEQARRDRVFSLDKAERYAGELTDGQVALIDGAYSYTPEDQPLRLAEAIERFCVNR